MTIRKMYLVPAEQYEYSHPQSKPLPQSPPALVKSRPSIKANRVAKKMKKIVTPHPHYKWVALFTKLLEADMKETDLIHRFADFLRKVLPKASPQKAPQQRP